MLAIQLLFLLAQALLQYPQQAGDGLDEATLERMQQRAEYLKQQMTEFTLELEQMKCDPDKSGHKERSSSNSVEEEGHNVAAKEDVGSNDANVEEENKDGKEEGNNVDAKAENSLGREAKEGYDDAKEDVNNDEEVEDVNAAGNGEDKSDANEDDDRHSIKRNLGSLSEVDIELPVLDLDRGCSVITDLMDKLIRIFGQGLSNSFYPVPQQAIKVGSGFEGWSSCTQDVVYCMFVPLSPPPGHAFHLELDTAGMLQRKFRVRVELLCTCTRERLGEDMLCFLHHPEEELRRKQDPSLLHTLCTGSYLDAKKTVHWFYRFMRIAWMLLPQSPHWHLVFQPCSRSCKFLLKKDKEIFAAEVIFGVQQGDSDIFVSSQPAEVGIPSTTWLETHAVAEAKFFQHISRQALQLAPRDFRQRLMDILKYLLCSLDTKQPLRNGQQEIPEEISLPSDFRVAQPPNLFQHLASSPDAHTKALQSTFTCCSGSNNCCSMAVERDPGAQSCASGAS
ncbi:inositol 1,4,5-trisphosphate receptor-interacting protein-like 1 [Ammospiza nelsoni]|uniref:inositol 1,4,5-trisphosphate receptor-interacting protein-like 1 n=1 Tax=Ammospiza nelsoni TaxID=2857394 RepID=UPI00286A179B|nr:inositol 1,4,5-trisphosphate receptor-interacting protein-like 1 [Ammospiza nelsoni]